jgi:hypothetical protein
LILALSLPLLFLLLHGTAHGGVIAHFAREVEPKVLITTCYKPSKLMFTFLTEILVRTFASCG